MAIYKYKKNKMNNEVKDIKKRGRKVVLTDEEREQRKEERRQLLKILYKNVYGPRRDKTIRVICECGEDICKNNAARHRKSQKHINTMANKHLDIEGK
jgi:hypothetical protein